MAVREGRISDVGKVDAEAPVELDARGLAVAPGFIDVHSHSDYTLLVDPRAVSAIHQGVTTEVIGNCGHGCFPIRDPGLSSRIIYGYDGTVPLDWSTPAAYLERLEQAAPAVNVMTLVPNGQLRLATVGLDSRPANDDEVAAMTRLLEEGMEAGAWGYSTGLEYATEQGAQEPEITALARATPGGAASTPPTPASGSSTPTRRWPRPFAPPATRASSSRSPTSRPAAVPTRPTAASTSWMPPGRPATTSPSTCIPGSTA